ncbi:helix-turn-helix domain-containing protein [Streptomyces erythrochromogenes]|uniref:helix-turn-helix domain-containing protein n=1 Tax=Streptomyces erythrochromogenes TaxID=285574 RepID=UPI0036910001
MRDLRRLRDIPQAQLADAVGCSRSAVSMWETKDQRPNAGHLVKLAGFLGVDPSDLLEGPSVSGTLKDLREARGLTQNEVARLIGVTPATYCNVETGRQGLPNRWVPILQSAFNSSEQTIRRSTPPKRQG